MKRWVVMTKRADFDAIGEELRISPMLARIARNRGLETVAAIRSFLYGKLEDLHDPELLPNLKTAVMLLKGMIEGGGKIRVIGDYDVDGVCAAYILVKSLRSLGADVSWQLPDRIRDGYGLNVSIVDKAAADGISMILTCDNGIAAVEEIRHAKELGMCVLVTDHHEPQETLPPADAIVDPKVEGSVYPFRDICGAFVAYKLVQKLCLVMQKDLPGDLLEFAAFATVCDVMPLLDENHILVRYGLEKMKQTANLGLSTLIDVTGCKRSTLSVYQLGFVLGPCVNAAGRLDAAGRALELFLTDDKRIAAQTAQDLVNLNTSRKSMTEAYAKEAVRIVGEGDANNPVMAQDQVLVVYLPDCHESLAGIIAGRVREAYYRPTIVLTGMQQDHEQQEGNGPGDGSDKAQDGSFVKGSGRSIEAYDMFASLSAVSELFEKFGGHKMAAGLTLAKENIEALRQKLNDNAHMSEEDLTEKVKIDIAMPIRYATDAFIRELDLLTPYGVGNPTPLFAQKDLTIDSIYVPVKSRNVVKLRFTGEEAEAIWFGDGDAFLEAFEKGMKVSVVYTPQLNEYMGTLSRQMVIKEIKPDT